MRRVGDKVEKHPDRHRRGALLATQLAGSWHNPLAPLGWPSALLEELTPLLLESGAAGMAWRRLQDDPIRLTPAARKLRQAYRFNTLDAARHEAHLGEIFPALRDAGIEPVLVKGWSVARLYPGPGLRPCGDMDLCVPPGEVHIAKNTLANADPAAGIDLHAGFSDLDDRAWEEVWKRTRLVPLDDSRIRILGAEDQLRHLCLHLMRHGDFRPLWLVDVAVAVETRPADFDWDYCLSGKRRLSQWVLCTLGLAECLLGARLDEPVLASKTDVPGWLQKAVLDAWSMARKGDSHMCDNKPLLAHLRKLSGLIGALRRRWPNPIEAAFKMGASPWTPLPLLSFQIGYLARRASRWPGKMRRTLQMAELPFAFHQDENR